MRRTVRLTALLTVSALSAGLTACSSRPAPDSAVGKFLDGWRTGQFASDLTIISADGATLSGTDVATKIKTLAGDLAPVKPTLKAGKTSVTKNDATVPIDVSWPIGGGAWAYQTTLRLSYDKDKWRPIWEPAVFAPQVTEGDKLTVKSTPAQRGDILDGAGQPIFSTRTVVDIGVDPGLVKDAAALAKALDEAFKSVHVDVDVSNLPAQIKAGKSGQFIEVVPLRDAVYQQIRNKIHDLDGTVFHSSTRSLGLTSVFARALLGTVGEVTKERMDAKPGKYQQGDLVGFGGLGEAYDDRLRGTPGVTVAIAGKPNGSGGTEADKIVFRREATPGQPLKTTIDVKTQNAADAALAGSAQPAALVAIRISDGAILAVANGPGQTNLNLAFTAQVPPGSMFKAVTATNLLEAGKVDVNTPVDCTPSLNVNGRIFKNAEGEVPGRYPLHVDFAVSCNTAFASLAPQLGPTGLRDTAAKLGIGIPWDLGINAFTGKVSVNGDPAEQAAAAFGQGTTLVSPVAMAACAAGLARGQWKQPHLLTDPVPAKPAADGPAFKPSTVDAMHQMMREVVTDGTAKGVKGVPGAPISGKTGTAEFDNDPAHTHSWFMGFRGDVAFAVFVQNGGMSTAAAVPDAGKFFTSLG
jgi:cell division protein FtsI/penicillin-binding protein 2